MLPWGLKAWPYAALIVLAAVFAIVPTWGSREGAPKAPQVHAQQKSDSGLKSQRQADKQVTPSPPPAASPPASATPVASPEGHRNARPGHEDGTGFCRRRLLVAQAAASLDSSAGPLYPRSVRCDLVLVPVDPQLGGGGRENRRKTAARLHLFCSKTNEQLRREPSLINVDCVVKNHGPTPAFKINYVFQMGVFPAQLPQSDFSTLLPLDLWQTMLRSSPAPTCQYGSITGTCSPPLRKPRSLLALIGSMCGAP